MSKIKKHYQCNECGALHMQWSGQCSDCNEWNTLQEVIISKSSSRGQMAGDANKSISLLKNISAAETTRISIGLEELDRVLGGGLVAGSVILIGGDPGIGKSTLLLQVLAQLNTQSPCLYVSGEESLQQISLRAQRLKIDAGELRLATETRIETVLALAEQEKPHVMVVDSIQTLYTDSLSAAPGSVSQVRESVAQLVRFAKQSNTAIFIIGHVTKEGTLAGPRVVEHMVDTVLYFEGDASSRYRIVRAVKNRFGAVNELGVFAMTTQGLKAVSNPSAIFLSRHEQPVPGSIIMVTREGTRPLLVEVQALVDDSQGNNPRRVTLGLEQNRLAMLLAVLHRHGGLAMYNQDVFVNVVGGVRVTETASDLPVVLAALSSFRNRPWDHQLVTFGEIGLAGEIRPVPNGEERLIEASKLGFTRAIVPIANLPRKSVQLDMEIIPVQRISDIMNLI
ncbi:MAG: DNA repair protein RadA [Gammaproteobacteria bacterium]|nr:DNA repair protein RadA [Gammaproteobacteria bacterium]